MAEQSLHDMQAILMFGANTDDAVNWQRIQEKLREAPLPLTPKGHVSVLIDLANGHKVPGGKWNQFVGVRIQKGADNVPVALPPGVLKLVKHNLSVIAEGASKARADAARAIAEEVSGSVLIAPTWSAERGRQDRVIARSMGSAIAYGFWLLTDTQSELSGTLCRCGYSQCRKKFFLKRPGKGGRGAPGRKYCTARHAELGDREKAKERMRRKRK